MSVLSVNDNSVKKGNHCHCIHDSILCLNFIFKGKCKFNLVLYMCCSVSFLLWLHAVIRFAIAELHCGSSHSK